MKYISLLSFKFQISVFFFVFVGSGCVVALATRVDLPPKDTRISCFDAQPRAEGFEAGVFQQFHRYNKATKELGQWHFASPVNEGQLQTDGSSGNYELC